MPERYARPRWPPDRTSRARSRATCCGSTRRSPSRCSRRARPAGRRHGPRGRRPTTSARRRSCSPRSHAAAAWRGAAAPLPVFVFTALASTALYGDRAARGAAAGPDAGALLAGRRRRRRRAARHAALDARAGRRLLAAHVAASGLAWAASRRGDPLRGPGLGRRLAGRRPHAAAPRADGRARGARPARRARGRARAAPGGGRGAHAHRPRPARLGRPRDQRDPGPRRAGRAAQRGATPRARARRSRRSRRSPARPSARSTSWWARCARTAPARHQVEPPPGAGRARRARRAPSCRGARRDDAVEGAARDRFRRASTVPPTASFRRRSRTPLATAAAAPEVEVGFGADELELTVANPLRADRPAADGGGGHGLVGMRERAALLGGSLEAGARDGRFRVHARLPLAGRRRDRPRVRVLIVDDDDLMRDRAARRALERRRDRGRRRGGRRTRRRLPHPAAARPRSY